MTTIGLPVAVGSASEEVMLAVSSAGDTIVELIADGGRSHVYQYRRAGVVLAEATTLRALSAGVTTPAD